MEKFTAVIIVVVLLSVGVYFSAKENIGTPVSQAIGAVTTYHQALYETVRYQ